MGEGNKIEKPPRQTVMIIEDSAGIREPMADHFREKFGFDVVTASEGQEAIDLIREMKFLPCVVFLDLMMPGMDGWSFLDYVMGHDLLPDVQIVITTAATNPPKNFVILKKPFGVADIENFATKCCGPGGPCAEPCAKPIAEPCAKTVGE